jgi:hypothetical protein
MRKQFDTRKANPQKTDMLRAGALMQRSLAIAHRRRMGWRQHNPLFSSTLIFPIPVKTIEAIASADEPSILGVIRLVG